MKNNIFWNYILKEKKYLLFITITGLIYNIGLTATPYFEGQLAGCIVDIYEGTKTSIVMIHIALLYVIVIALVQAARYLKRYYVRKFGNDINRNLKMDVYWHFVNQVGKENKEDSGSIMTKAIQDADACSEGIRKFTTEIFDTGIALISYIVLLAIYDYKLTLLAIIFQLFAYIIADQLGPIVAKNTHVAKRSAESLNASTLDRIHLAITYRIFGQESHMHELYENDLKDYEEKTIRSNLFETALKPLYQVISMLGMVFILFIGAKNVNEGIWGIAVLTTYISCFTKMAKKSGNAAKLFNAVQKAKVSWIRISPILSQEDEVKNRKQLEVKALEVNDLSYSYENKNILSNVTFSAHAGEIIGVTGEIASGKSTLGRMFLEDSGYQGSIKINGLELRDIERDYAVTSYMGHHLELFDDTVENNICYKEKGNINHVLDTVCMHDEVNALEEGIHTRLGEGGIKLSGGQQSRIALARTLYHARGIIVLDDPFSACDKITEKEIYKHLRSEYQDTIIILISHRLVLFKDLDQVLFIDNGQVEVSTHEALLKNNEKYKKMYTLQEAI